MRRKIKIITLIFLSLLGLWLLSRITPWGYTRIELTEEDRGDKILSVVVPDGEPVTLTWRNSQFGLHVTEGFFARNGFLVQDRVYTTRAGRLTPGGSPGLFPGSFIASERSATRG
jgi:hypothetical protein